MAAQMSLPVWLLRQDVTIGEALRLTVATNNEINR